MHLQKHLIWGGATLLLLLLVIPGSATTITLNEWVDTGGSSNFQYSDFYSNADSFNKLTFSDITKFPVLNYIMVVKTGDVTSPAGWTDGTHPITYTLGG
jgi:hypothetical protein